MAWTRPQQARAGSGQTMKYAIQVHSGPGHSSAAHSAYQFSKAALAEGHEILRMFFYQDGVHHGFGPTHRADPAAPDWAGLARHGIDLVLCASAASRRGLLHEDETAWGSARLVAGFRIGGLGQWMDACLQADRVLVFGG